MKFSSSTRRSLSSRSSEQENGNVTMLPQHTMLGHERYEGYCFGPPVQPLEFPKPNIHVAVFESSARVVDKRQRKSNGDHTIHNLTVLSRPLSTTTVDEALQQQQLGYWIQKKIASTTYGSVYLCAVLHRPRRRHHDDRACDLESLAADWTVSSEVVALKCSAWSKIRRKKRQHFKDPLKEAACLQLIGNYHPNILGCLEVLQDETYLYTIMSYCSGGDLGSLIQRTSPNSRPPVASPNSRSSSSSSHSKPSRPSDSPARSTTSTHSNGTTSYVSTDDGSSSTAKTISRGVRRRALDENRARMWFRQLLEALKHMQAKGVCHRDLNIANILLDGDTLIVIGFGVALRVPFMDKNNAGGISDVSEGGNRLLLQPQAYRGSRAFLAPEILERDAAFDGFAADLWSAGVLLFVFLVGLAPFKEPNATADRRFREISQGKLKELMASNLPEKTVSDEACDLLQNMLWRDPSKRLTLSQVIQHPWVIGPPPHQALTKQSLPTSLPPGKTIHDFLSRSDHGSNANTPSATTLRFSRKASI